MPRLFLAAAYIVLYGAAVAAPAVAQHAPVAPAAAALPAAQTASFQITIDPSVLGEPYTGRIYIAIARGERPEPRVAMGGWFGGPVVVVKDVEGLAPGEAVVIDGDEIGHPGPLSSVEPGEYVVQAVARRSPDSPKPGAGVGDLYSEPARVRVEPGAAVELRIGSVVQPRPLRETERVKLFEMVSPSLSAFHGREMTIRAGVRLPEGWTEDAERTWPVVYFITGFGGDHTQTAMVERMIGTPPAGAESIIVVPDPTWYRGHTVFADSANNGPWGTALVEELIPALEERFRGEGTGSRRYVTGISSGGWSAIWLQMTYPDAFAGCWSHVPDPVDFRDFQRIDLYAPGSNMYRDAEGERRPLARRGADQVMMWYDDFVRQEIVMGPGGQIHAFEAVFSPKGADGNPAPIFDRETGQVDHAAARAWEKYDIRLQLEEQWGELGPKLAGKLHVYAGEHDTFYLEGATRLLRASLAEFGSDAVVEIVPGMPHMFHSPGLKAMWDTILATEQGRELDR